MERALFIHDRNTDNSISELDRYELAILAIQETRWPGSGNHKTEKATLFYSGGSEHERGVGFVVSDRILNNIKRFESINDRLCLLEIQAKWFNIILINCYAPRLVSVCCSRCTCANVHTLSSVL